MEQFIVEFKFQSQLHLDPRDCVIQIQGTVFCINDSEKSEACTVNAIKIDIERAIDEDNDTSDMFYFEDEIVYDALDAIYIDSDITRYKDEVVQMWPDCYGKGLNVLIITKVLSSEQHAGRYIEVPAIHRTVQQNCHGCSLVVLCAEPLEQAMRDYALLLGFQELSDNKFMILNTVVPNPDLDFVFDFDLMDRSSPD